MARQDACTQPALRRCGRGLWAARTVWLGAQHQELVDDAKGSGLMCVLAALAKLIARGLVRGARAPASRVQLGQNWGSSIERTPYSCAVCGLRVNVI